MSNPSEEQWPVMSQLLLTSRSERERETEEEKRKFELEKEKGEGCKKKKSGTMMRGFERKQAEQVKNRPRLKRGWGAEKFQKSTLP